VQQESFQTLLAMPRATGHLRPPSGVKLLVTM
jgi:hypothetical protein